LKNRTARIPEYSLAEMLLRRLLPLVAAAALAACGGSGGNADACSNADGALGAAAFVFVQTPGSGDRVSSGFEVKGCASTFEGNVVWSLRGRDGRRLAGGAAQGGSLEPGPFSFTVEYEIAARQVGRLEVAAPRVTSEGFPPVTNVVPLVLAPHS
jgi:Immunoglobulin-like domain of bacterial spore germination